MYYSYGNYDRAILAATIIPIIISLVVSIGLAIGLGFLTKHMNEKKGYTGGFAWGFWLGVIGVIVVACKTDLTQPSYPANQNAYYQQNSGQAYSQPDSFGYSHPVYNAQPAANQNRNNDPIEAITQLAKLHDQGILTDQEFEMLKAEQLKRC